MATLFLHDGQPWVGEVVEAFRASEPEVRVELWPGSADAVPDLLRGVELVVILGGLHPALGRLAMDRLDALLAAAGAAGVRQVVQVDGRLPIEPERCARCGPGPARPDHLVHVLLDGAPRAARGNASRLDAWARALGGRLLTAGGVHTTLLATGFVVRADGSAPEVEALCARLGADIEGIRLPEGWVNFVHAQDLAALLVALRRERSAPPHRVLLAAGWGDHVSRLAIDVAVRLGRTPPAAFVEGPEARALSGRFRTGGVRSPSLPRWTSVVVEELLAGCPWDSSAARALLGREWTPVVPLLLAAAARTPARGAEAAGAPV